VITRLGIGIITCDRKEIVLSTLARVRAHTVYPSTTVVADDGSRDGTVNAVRDQRVPVIAGARAGVARNKNRALFYLFEIARCDIAILLEDDTLPAFPGWEQEWMLAAARYGHVNVAADTMRAGFLSGSGTADDPVRGFEITSHCAAFTREAIAFGGYFDARFTGGGFENVELAGRLLRLGYGGELRIIGEVPRAVHFMIAGGVAISHPPTRITEVGRAQNRQVATNVVNETGYRPPWHDDDGMAQFRAEMAAVYPRIAQQLVVQPHAQAPHLQAPHVQAPHVQAPHVQAPHVQAPQSGAEKPRRTARGAG
jgi:glycosyltransferase involved in cell wall biosynthesis